MSPSTFKFDIETEERDYFKHSWRRIQRD